MVAALNKQSQAVLEKAFELVEISNRRDALLEEFQAMIEGAPKRTSKARKPENSSVTESVGPKKKIPARGVIRYPTKRGAPDKAERILALVKTRKAPKGGWTNQAVAVALGEPDNIPSVTATLSILYRLKKIRRIKTGVYARK
jgi:hypothetical protein